jgi:signal transduction histidine kinase/CheY-like chemotaxis protein
MIAIFSIPLAAIFVYLMVSKLVKRPVENLAEKAKRFAEGDTSVSADVKTEDEIGILGNTFNYMVESVSAASKKLELEVTRKTALLDERTKLIVLLERANKELRELDKLKSTFLANMSHELRTPMNAIIGYTDLLIDGVDGPINDEQEKSLTKVVANARHLLQLINDILDVSKIESGRIEIEPKEIDLKWIIESVIPTFEPLIKQKGLTLTVNLDEGLPPVYGDEDKVKQIFINLLSNAVKFTHRGGVTISAKLSERGIKPGEPPLFAESCVEDTGIGIKDENLGKIFDKFTQVDISAIRQYEGTGLGLSIARGLVALHKGMIWVTSKYGEGSRFCFILPLKKEILERPAEPVIEPSMAEGLAEYFGKPVKTFLKGPQYAGKPIRCWEYIHCGQTTCPAYGGKESRCWLILGTHCEGMKIAAYPEKVDFCKGCEIIRSLIVEPEEYKLVEAVPLEEEGVARKTVLAIDDNPEAIDIISKYLGEDYRVVSYLSGEGAVEKAKEIKPMAITLDIMMPKKDGWQVLQELKKTPETQDIPVMVLSIIDNKRLGFSLGAAEYLVKPVERQVLLRKLRNLEKTTVIKKVLVVDNEPDTVELGNVLKEAGYQITIANNSKDAIKAVKDFVPDLIVLNLTMPEVSGFDVIEYLKTEEGVKDIPLVLITHKDLTEKEIDEMNGRIQGILNKGVLAKEDLLKELKSTISKAGKMQ